MKAKRHRLVLAGLLGLGVMLGASLQASAESGPAVLYSYERFAIGNDVQYVLVPRSSQLTVDTATELSPAVVNGLFNELRKHKSATYGGTSIDASPASLKKGQVTVKVDPEKERYFVIIAAEVVSTLSGLGVESVSFPGLAKKPMTAADVELGVYSLHIPAWRALPPKKIAPATVVMPDGASLDAAAFYGLIAKKDAAVGKMVEGYLKRDEPNVVVTVLRSLPALALPGWERQALPGLTHADSSVRMAAVETLAGQESDEVLEALVRVLDKDKDAAVQAKAAEVLGASKNRRYAVYALFYQLRGGDEAAAIKAIDAIIKLKEPTAAGEMAKTARGEREAVALKAIEALGALESSAELRKLFEDGKVALPRRQAAARQLLSSKEADARVAATGFLAVQGAPADAKAAIDALAKEKDRARLEAALEHVDSGVRRYAAEALAGLKDPASLKALAAVAEKHPDDAEAIQTSASVIMGGLGLNDVLTYTSSKNIVLQRVAYEALGAKAKGGGKRVFDVLVEGMKSKDAGIRAASSRALAGFGDDKALETLLAAGKDSDARVRRNVATALAAWPANATTGRGLLVEYLKDSDPTVTAAAVETITKRQETEVFADVLPLYKSAPHPDARVRSAVLRALHAIAPEKERSQVISVLSGGLFDKDPETKAVAIDLLGRYDDGAAVIGLSSLINDPDERWRVLSIAALGRTHSADAVELLASVVNDKNKNVRLAAVEALGENGRPAAGEVLKKQIAVEQDADVLAAAKKAQKKIK